MNTVRDNAIRDDAGELLVARIVEFIRLARSNGFQAGIGESLDAARLAECCGALDRQLLRDRHDDK